MVQSPSWEANWFADSQEIPRISRNPKVHYRTHKRPPPVSILDQPNPVYNYSSSAHAPRPVTHGHSLGTQTFVWHFSYYEWFEKRRRFNAIAFQLCCIVCR